MHLNLEAGTKVETGEGEEGRELWFFIQLTVSVEVSNKQACWVVGETFSDDCCLSTMSCPQKPPTLNERSQQLGKRRSGADPPTWVDEEQRTSCSLGTG